MVSLILISILIVLSGYKADKGVEDNSNAIEASEETRVATMESVIEIAKDFIGIEFLPHIVKTIANIDEPDIESIDGYGPENKEVWEITYVTTRDRFLGPIVFYIEKDSLEICDIKPRPYQ